MNGIRAWFSIKPDQIDPFLSGLPCPDGFSRLSLHVENSHRAHVHVRHAVIYKGILARRR
jgi:hypothetical protein